MGDNSTALITGASAGFGRALALALSAQGWRLIITARGAERLEAVRAATGAYAVVGDIADPTHRAQLVGAVEAAGRLDLVINNASALGPSPLPRLDRYPLDDLAAVYETNVIAPLAVLQATLPLLRSSEGIAVNISSDAAVGAYEGWGGYGSSKAALDQVTAVLAAENPELRIYSFDPGDMRTEMHQAAFPGEEISDRPEPETVVPTLLQLIGTRPDSGRYLASELAVRS
ncbi:SDR family oxidoreductase [Nocardia uniformis]|uniref:SDR family oxidoreductase n=1 Tax=Nocardia uniformis TaxID=53432 RepID=A0A849CC48_9NOCA|nr:SDR family oxidoreductase [Nocardia uniformis]NNH72529.1 SDR family oxidoreductase [Nocardia uniformis]